jgi:hypothetical protein
VRPCVEDDHDGFGGHAGFGTVEVIEGNQEPIKTALGAGDGDDQLALQPVERTHDGHFSSIARCRNAQIGTTPSTRNQS